MFERKTFSFASSKCFPIHTHRGRIKKLFKNKTSSFIFKVVFNQFTSCELVEKLIGFSLYLMKPHKVKPLK